MAQIDPSLLPELQYLIVGKTSATDPSQQADWASKKLFWVPDDKLVRFHAFYFRLLLNLLYIPSIIGLRYRAYLCFIIYLLAFVVI